MRKKKYLIMTIMMVGVMLAGCNKTGPMQATTREETQTETQEETQTETEEQTETQTEEQTEAQTEEQTGTEKEEQEGMQWQALALPTPEVKDGVMMKGEDAVETKFEWNMVEGATGYEVSVESKYYEDEKYEAYETVETTETSYVAGAQDYFDFRIKVRAYSDENGERLYSDWSEYAEGKTYN